MVLNDVYERSLEGKITKKDAAGLLKANPSSCSIRLTQYAKSWSATMFPMS